METTNKKIVCPYCKSEIEADSWYCDQCGKEILYCPECERPKRGTVCHLCGEDLIPASQFLTRQDSGQTEPLTDTDENDAIQDEGDTGNDTPQSGMTETDTATDNVKTDSDSQPDRCISPRRKKVIVIIVLAVPILTAALWYLIDTHHTISGEDLAFLYYGDINGDLGTAINLSDKERANCYIVPDTGHYCFDARFQGNSMDVNIHITKAAVLWETFNSDELPTEGDLISEIDCRDGYVFFTTNQKYREGNALVAVYNELDMILWSWHLWFASFNPENELYKGEPADGAENMMSRNLGAVADTGICSFGMYYQWGRKDPLFIKDIPEQDYPMMYKATHNQTVGLSANQGMAADNPTVLFRIWDEVGIGWGYEKTKYDPCPPGWRVPEAGDGDNLLSYKMFKDARNPEAQYPGTFYWTLNSSKYWTDEEKRGMAVFTLYDTLKVESVRSKIKNLHCIRPCKDY